MLSTSMNKEMLENQSCALAAARVLLEFTDIKYEHQFGVKEGNR